MRNYWIVDNIIFVSCTCFILNTTSWQPVSLKKPKTCRIWVQKGCPWVVPFPSLECCEIMRESALRRPSVLPEHPMVRLASLVLKWNVRQVMFMWHFNTLGCGLVKRACHLQVSLHFNCLRIQFHTFFHFINEMLCFKPRGLPSRWSYNYAWAVCSCA